MSGETCLLPGREVGMKWFIVSIAFCSLGWTLGAHLVFHPIRVICIGTTTWNGILNQVGIPHCCLKCLQKHFTTMQLFNKKCSAWNQIVIVAVQWGEDSLRHCIFGFISRNMSLNYKMQSSLEYLTAGKYQVCLFSSS